MYFPLSELNGWGKRFTDQPQTIYSEVPLISSQYASSAGREDLVTSILSISFLSSRRRALSILSN